MSSENIERRIEFIIEQQAKFAEDIARLEEQNRENSMNIAKLVDVVMSLANVVQRHDDHLVQVDQRIEELAQLGKETDRRLKETDDRLNALITIVERTITDGSNN